MYHQGRHSWPPRYKAVHWRPSALIVALWQWRPEHTWSAWCDQNDCCKSVDVFIDVSLIVLYEYKVYNYFVTQLFEINKNVNMLISFGLILSFIRNFLTTLTTSSTPHLFTVWNLCYKENANMKVCVHAIHCIRVKILFMAFATAYIWNSWPMNIVNNGGGKHIYWQKLLEFIWFHAVVYPDEVEQWRSVQLTSVSGITSTSLYFASDCFLQEIYCRELATPRLKPLTPGFRV